jgi:putative DNA primase/helicase
MQRKLPGEKCGRLKDLGGLDLRQKCVRFVQDHGEAIGAAQPAVPAEMNDRASDIWEPLLALADLAGGDWPERARKAAVGLSARATEAEPIGALLMDIFELFLRWQKQRIFTRDVVRWLEMCEDRPWMVLKKGTKVTGHWLGLQLSGYGIRPKTMRIENERAKGYELADFREAFRRYIPTVEVERLRAELMDGTEKGSGATGDKKDDAPPAASP